MNTILNNLISLASEGAFCQKEQVAPMSPFKWEVLEKLANIEDISPYIYKGLLRHDDDKYTNIPEEILGKFAKDSFNDSDELSQTFDITDIESQKLSYALKKYLLKDIVYKERHSIDTSKISLDLLSLILQNTNIILRKGIRLRGLIELGIFLRTKGQYVDFVKTETWLQRLKLRKMACLQASVLVSLFHFDVTEFPYIKKTDKRAQKLAIDSLEKTYKMNKLEREVSKYDISNCMVFRKYSRSESLCKATSTLIRSISEIEE